MSSVTETIETSKSTNWVEESTYYTADHVLDAFQDGAKKAVSNIKKKFEKIKEENKKLAGEFTAAVYDFLKKNKIKPEFAYLRENSWDNYSIIVGITEKDFLKDEFLKTYEFISELEKEYEALADSKFLLSFLGINENFNVKCLYSDGFVSKFNK